MTRLVWLVLVLAGVTLAQPQVTRGGALKKRAYQTYGAMTLYVDPTGSDSGACTGTGTSACATINGAFAKLPKNIRHVVTVNIAAGTYASAVTLSGLAFSDAGSLIVQGSLTNLTPTTGSATGTITSYTGMDYTTTSLGTLTDNGQTWTADEFKGAILTITSGAASGQSRIVVGNTATSLSLNSSVTGLAAGATYALQLPSSIFTGNWSINGISGGTSATSPVLLSDITISSTAPMTVRSAKMSGVGAMYSVLFRRMRLVSTGTGLFAYDAALGTSSSGSYAVGGGIGAAGALYNSTLYDVGGYWVSGTSVGSSALSCVNSACGGGSISGFAVFESRTTTPAVSIARFNAYPPLSSAGTPAGVYRATAGACLKLAGDVYAVVQTIPFRCEGATGITLTGGASVYSTMFNLTTTTTDFSIDGENFSLAFINALTPKRVVGTQGSTVLLQ